CWLLDKTHDSPCTGNARVAHNPRPASSLRSRGCLAAKSSMREMLRARGEFGRPPLVHKLPVPSGQSREVWASLWSCGRPGGVSVRPLALRRQAWLSPQRSTVFQRPPMPHRNASFFHLHLVSDSTGETLITVARAACAQYVNASPVEHVYPAV